MDFLKPFISERNNQVNNFSIELEDDFADDLSNSCESPRNLINSEQENNPATTNNTDNQTATGAEGGFEIGSSDNPARKDKSTSGKKKTNISNTTKSPDPKRTELWKKKCLPPTAAMFKEYVDLKKRQYESRRDEPSQ